MAELLLILEWVPIFTQASFNPFVGKEFPEIQKDARIALMGGLVTSYFVSGRVFPWTQGVTWGEFAKAYVSGGVVAFAVAGKEVMSAIGHWAEEDF